MYIYTSTLPSRTLLQLRLRRVGFPVIWVCILCLRAIKGSQGQGVAPLYPTPSTALSLAYLRRCLALASSGCRARSYVLPSTKTSAAAVPSTCNFDLSSPYVFMLCCHRCVSGRSHVHPRLVDSIFAAWVVGFIIKT